MTRSEHPTYEQLVVLPAFSPQGVPTAFEDINGHLNNVAFASLFENARVQLHRKARPWACLLYTSKMLWFRPWRRRSR